MDFTLHGCVVCTYWCFYFYNFMQNNKLEHCYAYCTTIEFSPEMNNTRSSNYLLVPTNMKIFCIIQNNVTTAFYINKPHIFISINYYEF